MVRGRERVNLSSLSLMNKRVNFIISLVGRERVKNNHKVLIGRKLSSSQRVKVKNHFLLGWRVQYTNG